MTSIHIQIKRSMHTPPNFFHLFFCFTLFLLGVNYAASLTWSILLFSRNSTSAMLRSSGSTKPTTWSGGVRGGWVVGGQRPMKPTSSPRAACIERSPTLLYKLPAHLQTFRR